MESHPDFNDYGPFSDHDPPQKCSAYDGPYSRGVLEGWSFEDFPYDAGLDVNQFQSGLIFEPENGIAPLSFTMDFASSQFSSPTTSGYAGNSYANSTWVPYEVTEAHNELPTAGANIGYRDFRQEVNNGIISPSSITFQPLCNGHIKPPVYAPQQDSEPLLDGECGRNLLYNNSLGEIPPQQTKRTTPSRFRSPSKPKPRATKFYCEIPPCNHQKTFSRKADLERHRATQHIPRYSPKKKLSHCPWPDCEYKGEKGFPRRDKMLQHQDKVHRRRL